MARGWESKDVESQMEDAGHKGASPAKSLSEAERKRNRLLMDRGRILSEYQHACNARFKAQLEGELAFIDAELKKLEGLE